ncbi:MAG: DUF1405 domain-containing protein [Candidatus Heimdallarchaeota archaeon]|nr:DUF1405 domain-containing protein [Candidatus Heimdallarchaeota archaeon]
MHTKSISAILKKGIPKFFTHPIVLFIAIIINLFWGILGFIAYFPQTNGISFFLWLFIPDCPLYTVLFAAFLIDRNRIKTHQNFMWILTLGLLKFSLAAPMIFILFPQNYHAPPIFGINLPNIYPFDYFHLILFVQGIIIAIFFLERSFRNFAISFIWLLFNDFIDFTFFTFPFYYLVYEKLNYFLAFYAILNITLLFIGLFFIFNGSNYLKNVLIVKKSDIEPITYISHSMIEDET